MAKFRVTLADGRIVDGEIKTSVEGACAEPVLVVEGKEYTGLDAINEGITVDPIDDPIVDAWISTFRYCSQ